MANTYAIIEAGAVANMAVAAAPLHGNWVLARDGAGTVEVGVRRFVDWYRDYYKV